MTAPDNELEIRLRLPLDRFTLDVNLCTRQRVVGLFGPSGSGKTTILEALAGLRTPAEGRLRIGREVLLDQEQGTLLKPEQRGIGYLPQGSLLFPHWNVAANLMAGAARARRRGINLKRLREETVEALELGSLLDRPVDTLSGGERQRVALGRALCSGPRLLLLDEPLSALDAGLRHRILPFLVRIREQFDLPMVVVSHQPVELQAICDEVSALREGRIVATAPPTQLFARPDIYPLAREGGRFENLLPAVVKTQDARTTELALGRTGTGPTLVAPPLDRAPGQRLTVTLPAQDIILALAPPTGLSARNLLAGKITNLQSADGQEVATLVFAGLPEHPVLVELTGTAVQDLQLRPGMGLWALFKSSALTVAG